MTNTVRNAVTSSVSYAASNDRRTTVQNQNQNQTLYIHVCGVSGYDSIHRCRSLSAVAGHGWMLR